MIENFHENLFHITYIEFIVYTEDEFNEMKN